MNKEKEEQLKTIAGRLRRITSENYKPLMTDMVFYDLDALLNLILEEGKDE